MTTPNNQDYELSAILENLANSDDIYNQEAWVEAYTAILAWHSKQLEQATIEARIEGATMGAKFGNAAFRQYNIANPSKPINLDTVRQMGIEQATEWAEG